MRPTYCRKPNHLALQQSQKSRAEWAADILFLTVVLWLGVGSCFSRGLAQVQPANPAPDASAIDTAQMLLYVNPTLGNDSGSGSQQSPLRTLTRALQVAPANTTILLAAGTYSAESGETFPIAMKPGVTIQGDPNTQGQGIVISGGGDFISPTEARQNVALLGATQATLLGVTITNASPRGYGLWIESSNPVILQNTFANSGHDGISTVGNSAPLIENNRFFHNGANGITVFGSSRPMLRGNLFEQTGFGINIAHYAAPFVLNNRISGNKDGIVIQGDARPMLRGNVIEASQRDGLVAIARSQPDLGTADAPGNNSFVRNGRYDLNLKGTNQTIPAAGNLLAANRIIGNADLSGNTPITQPPAAARLPQALQPARQSSRPVAPPATARLASSSNPTLTQDSAPGQAAAVSAPSSQTAINIPVPPPDRPQPVRVAANIRSSGRSPASVSVAGSVAASVTESMTRPAAGSVAGSVDRITTLPPSTLPASSRVSSSASAGRQSAHVAPSSQSINIPVPPPARPVTALAVDRAVATSAPQVSAALSTPEAAPDRAATSSGRSAAPRMADLLPVPDGNPPVGNIGDMPTVDVPRNAAQRGVGNAMFSGGGGPAVPLRYRVVVEANSDRVQDMVRSLVPSAFATTERGRRLMQVGAFSSRDNAEEVVQLLNQNGLRAVIRSIDN